MSAIGVSTKLVISLNLTPEIGKSSTHRICLLMSRGSSILFPQTHALVLVRAKKAVIITAVIRRNGSILEKIKALNYKAKLSRIVVGAYPIARQYFEI